MDAELGVVGGTFESIKPVLPVRLGSIPNLNNHSTIPLILIIIILFRKLQLSREDTLNDVYQTFLMKMQEQHIHCRIMQKFVLAPFGFATLLIRYLITM